MQQRMFERRSDLRQGCQDKAAARERGVGKGEAGRIVDEGIDQQKVKVEGARTIRGSTAAVAAKLALDREKLRKQRLGIELGLQGHGSVDERRLIGVPDGFR